MKPIRILSIIAVVLLLMNGFLLTEILTRKPPKHPPHMDYKQQVIEQLHFDEQQIEAYEKLVQEHQILMVRLEELKGEKMAVYFNQLNQNDSGNTAVLMEEITRLEQQRIQVTYDHFAAIKALCRADQLQGFEEVVQKAMQMLASRNRGPLRKRD
jgi:periplasmic protein CpxP/Spy